MTYQTPPNMARIKSSIPVTVHDTAFMQQPIPLAVSRVTLHPWCSNYHPNTPARYTEVALTAAARDTLTRARAEAPDFYHGILIHAVQTRFHGIAEEPVRSTLQQYVSRHTDMGSLILQSPHIDFRDHILLTELRHGRAQPRWLWTALAARLLYPAEVVGDPPTALVDQP